MYLDTIAPETQASHKVSGGLFKSQTGPLKVWLIDSKPKQKASQAIT